MNEHAPSIPVPEAVETEKFFGKRRAWPEVSDAYRERLQWRAISELQAENDGPLPDYGATLIRMALILERDFDSMIPPLPHRIAAALRVADMTGIEEPGELAWFVYECVQAE